MCVIKFLCSLVCLSCSVLCYPFLVRELFPRPGVLEMFLRVIVFRMSDALLWYWLRRINRYEGVSYRLVIVCVESVCEMTFIERVYKPQVRAWSVWLVLGQAKRRHLLERRLCGPQCLLRFPQAWGFLLNLRHQPPVVPKCFPSIPCPLYNLK